MKLRFIILFGVFVFLSFLNSGVSAGVTKDKATQVRIISITDFHGSLEPSILKTKDGAEVTAGGAALLSAYLKRLGEYKEGPAIFIDAGDLFQGSLESNYFEGRPVVDLYNYFLQAKVVDQVVAVVGNHEFDFGPTGRERSIPKSKADDPRGALKNRIRQARFPFLSSNIVGNVPKGVRPSVVYEIQGIRIGIIGASTRDTPGTTMQENLVGLQFRDMRKYVLMEAKHLRNEGQADLVVLAAHTGASCSDPGGERGIACLAGTELGEVIEALQVESGKLGQPLVDVVLGGDSHMAFATVLSDEKYPMAVLQGGSYGRQIAWVDITLDTPKSFATHMADVCGSVVQGTCNRYVVREHDTKDGAVKQARFLGKTIQADPKFRNGVLAPQERTEIAKIQNRSTGVRVVSDMEKSYLEESALGNLVADLFRKTVENADVGLMNNGGIRKAFPAGELTFNEVFQTLPFDNLVVYMDAPAALLKKMIQLGISLPLRPDVDGAHSWSGVTFSVVYDEQEPRPEFRCKPKDIRVNGKPFDENGTYRIVSNSYLFHSKGSGFGEIQYKPDQVKAASRGGAMYDVVFDLLKKRGGELDPLTYFDAKNARTHRQKGLHECFERVRHETRK